MSEKKHTVKGESHVLRNVVILLLLISLGLLGYVFYEVAREDAFDKERIGLAGEEQVLSQSIAKDANQVAVGKVEALDALNKGVDRFDQSLELLKNGNPETGLPPSPEVVSDELGAVENQWADMRRGARLILSKARDITALQQLGAQLHEILPDLLTKSDELVTILVDVGASAHIINVTGRQRMLTQRISDNVDRALRGGEGAVDAADAFGRDAQLFGRVLNALRNGDDLMEIEALKDPDALEKLAEIEQDYKAMSGFIDDLLSKSVDLFRVQGASEDIAQTSVFLLDDTGKLVKAYTGLASNRFWTAEKGFILGGIALLLLLWLVRIFFTTERHRREQIEREREETEKRRAEADEQNRRNQEAILRLLDEISDLAEGDLSVRATVTEDFTGAIADSINYAIGEMRGLVERINTTTEQVTAAAQETQATAMHLAEASEHQAQQISSAGGSINAMSATMQESAQEADKATKVAQDSVMTAKSGAEAVRNTIHAMDSIREQIQETSKRIKRLGESSQEIGEIVGLINDIADQTNILALNAAIQAAMAGEAGRGFAVVADEVQRLAERVGNATKQIDALVKTIQSDTNEAVISMEDSTSGVVKGAQLAEGAGKSLEQIERVSDDIAKLVAHFSQTSQQQSEAAERISETVNVIQEITTQTSAGTNETANSIGHLAGLANDLRKSIAGFKLPA